MLTYINLLSFAVACDTGNSIDVATYYFSVYNIMRINVFTVHARSKIKTRRAFCTIYFSPT